MCIIHLLSTHSQTYLKLYSDVGDDLRGEGAKKKKKNQEHDCTLNWPMIHHPRTAILVYPRLLSVFDSMGCQHHAPSLSLHPLKRAEI